MKKDFEKLDKKKTKKRHHYQVLRRFKYKDELYEVGDIVEIAEPWCSSILIKYNYVR